MSVSRSDWPKDVLGGKLASSSTSSQRSYLDCDGCLGLADRFSQFIFVTSQSFTQRNLDRFGATWLLGRGKSVYLVDLSLLIWGENGIAAGQPDAIEGVLRPVSWDGFEEFLGQYGQDSLLLLYATPRTSIELFELITKHSVSTLYFDSGRIPVRKRIARTIGTGLRLLTSNPKLLLRKAFDRFLPQSCPKINIDYLIVSGLDSELNPPNWLNRAQISVPSHSYDYVIWNSSPPFVHDVPYIVFLDQAYPEHSDPVKLKITNPFASEIYYPQIENLLRYVGDAFQMPVLVALHPRSSRTNGSAPYQGFQTFVGRTASLVKGARLVVAHDSTAISFAVLSRKPLLLVKLDQMNQWGAGTSVIDSFSRVLGVPIIHINSRSLPSYDRLQVEESRYAWHEAMYVRHPECNGVYIWDRLFGTGFKEEHRAQ